MGTICINQPRFVDHVLCYGIMYNSIQEECPCCPERIKCQELTDYHICKKAKKPIKKKDKNPNPNIFIKGVK